MPTLKNLHHQTKARRTGKPAFTLLELIVVLLVLGILAAIAVPTFNRVKENSVVRVAQTTLEAAARNGEAIAKSDPNASDAQIAAAVESEFTAGSGLTVSVVDGTVTVSQSNGSVTASGSVEFTNGVPTITNASVSGGGSPATTVAAPVVYAIGDVGPGGGKVYYVHASGTFACGATLESTCKYLEAAPNTWGGGSADPIIRWAVTAHQSSDIASIANDSSTAYNNVLGIGLGYKNSVAIVNQGNDTTTAAGAARAYTGGSQSDWYLPTTAELNLLCQWARNVTQDVTTRCIGGSLNTGTGASGGFSTGRYWSSSESIAGNAWNQHFSTGSQFSNLKYLTPYVRPVRAFS